MPTTLTSLFATALHEAKVAESEPIGIQRAAALLVTAAGARRIEWLVGEDGLAVNGIPLRPGAPGASLVVECLEQHLTRRLALPAGLTARQWVELAGLYASAPGIYPTAEHMRAAVAGIVPGATFEHSAERIAAEAGEGGLHRDGPGLGAFADAIEPGDRALTSRETGLSELTSRIDPLLDAARQAVDRADWSRLAELLLKLDQVAGEGDEATRSIIARERRRLLPLSAIEHLVGEIPSANASSVELQALTTLGRDGTEAIFELLAAEPSRSRHRLYLDILVAMDGTDDAIIGALGSGHDAVARDAATVVGRRRMERVVPVLGALLRHADEGVRTAAWRALEDIGTAEARALIR